MRRRQKKVRALADNSESHVEQVRLSPHAEGWKRENRDALEAYTQFFQSHGIWNAAQRGW